MKRTGINILIQISNSDDKLTQREWSEFVEATRGLLNSPYKQIHGEWFSASDSPWQNANWCIELQSPDQWNEIRQGRPWSDDWRANWVAELRGALRAHLAALCVTYRQDSIAWTEGRVEFLEPTPKPEEALWTVEPHDPETAMASETAFSESLADVLDRIYRTASTETAEKLRLHEEKRFPTVDPPPMPSLTISPDDTEQETLRKLYCRWSFDMRDQVYDLHGPWKPEEIKDFTGRMQTQNLQVRYSQLEMASWAGALKAGWGMTANQLLLSDLGKPRTPVPPTPGTAPTPESDSQPPASTGEDEQVREVVEWASIVLIHHNEHTGPVQACTSAACYHACTGLSALQQQLKVEGGHAFSVWNAKPKEPARYGEDSHPFDPTYTGICRMCGDRATDHVGEPPSDDD